MADLPAELPAAVFLVVHRDTALPELLPELLSSWGPLCAAYPVHGETFVPSRIYIAPPDDHLLVRQGHVDVVRGPKESGHRPSADALFRSAAAAYGPRVVGVVLSGYFDCGTAGLLSIKARGGVAVVQDPSRAAVPSMPQSAVDHVAVDHIVAPSELGRVLARLVSEPAVEPRTPVVPREIVDLEQYESGATSRVVCPVCNGAMTETAIGQFEHFRCHLGHTFSTDAMLAEQAESLERALWAAVRALEDSATIAGRVARGATAGWPVDSKNSNERRPNRPA